MRFNGLMREWFREILSMNPQSNLCKSLSHLGQRIVPAQFMVPMNDSQIVEAFHEPERRAPPRLVDAIGRKLPEAVLGAPMPHFMVPMRNFEIVEAPHEPPSCQSTP